MLFEPGLDLAAGREARQDRAADAPSADAEPTETAADLASKPPPVASDLPTLGRPHAGHGPSDAGHGPSDAPSPAWPAESGQADLVRLTTLGGPQPPESAAPAPPGRPRPPHPVFPGSALRPRSFAAEPAVPPRPAHSAAEAILPVPPTGQEPAAPRAPARLRHPPDGNPAAASRRSAAREARAEPVVHISIGRVEIRADRAAAPRPERQASRLRPAAPDLSEYLQRRGQRR
jgi:hypothetical protein